MAPVGFWVRASVACVVVSVLAACSHEFDGLWAEETSSEALWGRADDACHRCLHASCTDQAASCAGDGTCRTQVACLSSCADASCVDQCVVDGEAPPVECWRAACFDACWVDSGWADSTEQLLGGRMSAACGACFDRECSDVAPMCEPEAECSSHLSCYASCDDPPCVDRCLGRTEGDDAVICLRAKCFEECDNGQRFACLHDYRDPHDAPDELTVTATFVEFFTNAPQRELEVQLCFEPGLSCPKPLREGRTDDQGMVSFTVEPTQRPGPGVTAYLRISGPDTPPTRYYSEFPLYGDREFLLFTHSLATVNSTQELLNVQRVPGRGAILAVLRDCQDDKAPSMRMSVLEADELTQVIYQRGVELSTEFTATDNSGLALIVNVPPGQVTLQGFANDGKDLVIERTFGLEADGITWVSTAPIQK